MKNLLLLISLIVGLLLLYFFLDSISVIEHELTLGDVGNIVILAITAWMVWIYTVEAQESNEIQEKPILNLYLKKNSDDRFSILKIQNVGKGPAYNIVIRSIKVDGFTYSFSFREPNFILGPDQPREVGFEVKTPNGGAELYENTNSHTFELFIDRLFPRSTDPSRYDLKKRGAAIFVISFEGLNSKKYHTVFRLYPKAWPLLNVYDLALEYISSGTGECTNRSAMKNAMTKEISYM